MLSHVFIKRLSLNSVELLRLNQRLIIYYYLHKINGILQVDKIAKEEGTWRFENREVLVVMAVMKSS